MPKKYYFLTIKETSRCNVYNSTTFNQVIDTPVWMFLEDKDDEFHHVVLFYREITKEEFDNFERIRLDV